MRWDLEELARVALERANVGSPVDPDILAKRRELVVRDGGPGCDGYLIGDRIFVDEALPSRRRGFAIAHETGHHVLREAGLEVPERPDERAANYLASAMLLPRPDFEADLRRYGWDLIALCAKHRFASFEAVARRIVALRDAHVHVFDRPLAGQRKPGRYSVPYGLRPTDEERLAAREAVACGAPVELRAGLTAWPVMEHNWARAIVLVSL